MPDANLAPPRTRYDRALFVEAFVRLTRHGGDGLAAGVAFGMLLSMAPLLVVAVAISSLWVGDGGAREHVVDLVAESIGRQAARLVGAWVDEARAWSGTATMLGLAGFFIGGSRLVAIVDSAFEVIFETPRRTLSFRESVRAFLHTQAMGVGVTLLVGSILVASVLVRALSDSALGLSDAAPVAAAGGLIRVFGSFALLTCALAVVYRLLPPCRLTRSEVVEGALVTAVLLEATSWVLSVVVEHVDVAAAYGAAGAVVAALVWLFVAAELFLFGAEVTAELAERRIRRASDQVLPSVPVAGLGSP